MASLTPRCSESSPSGAIILAPLDGSEERGHVERPLRDARRELQRGAAASLGSRPCRVSRAGASRTSRVSRALASGPQHRDAFLSALTARVGCPLVARQISTAAHGELR